MSDDYPVRMMFRTETLIWKCPRCRCMMPPINKGVHEIMGCIPPKDGELVGREMPGFIINTGGA